MKKVFFLIATTFLAARVSLAVVGQAAPEPFFDPKIEAQKAVFKNEKSPKPAQFDLFSKKKPDSKVEAELEKADRMAKTSLIFGILGWLTLFFFIGFLLLPMAYFFGMRALKHKTRRRRMALTGAILGAVFFIAIISGLIVLLLAYIQNN